MWLRPEDQFVFQMLIELVWLRHAGYLGGTRRGEGQGHRCSSETHLGEGVQQMLVSSCYMNQSEAAWQHVFSWFLVGMMHEVIRSGSMVPTLVCGMNLA